MRVFTGAISEDELLTNVLTLLRLRRWLANHVRRSDRGIIQGDAGFPDIIAARPPRLLFAELKSEGGKPTRYQQEWIDRLVKAGVEIYVWTPTDWLSGDIDRVLT